MRIAVIGGGLSGCCAASVIAASRTLAAKCPALEVTVFESGRGLGGRASTRRLESGGRVDHGCQYISIKPPPASDHRFASLVDRLERSGAVAEWKGHFCELHTSGTIEESDDAAKNKRRMVGVGGMNNICKTLIGESSRISTRFGSRVREIRFDEDGDRKWHLHIANVTARHVDENSASSVDNGDLIEGPFDGLVATDKLLASDSVTRLFGDAHPMSFVSRTSAADPSRNSESVEKIIGAMRMTSSTPSFVLMLEMKGPILREIFDGANIHGSDVIAWVSKDSSKPGRGVEDAMSVQRWVIQSTGDFARRKLDGSGELLRKLKRGSDEYKLAFERIGDELLEEFISLLESAYNIDGKAAIVDNVTSRTVHRWGSAFPDVGESGDFHLPVVDADTMMAVCGDWTRAPQAEGAAVSGIIAGEALVEAILSKRESP